MEYAAFISYTHKDEAVARRLQRQLEGFRLPRGIDPKLKSNLKPIFRDVTELTAHHSLTEKIREAINHSRFLIVVCSPNAQKSHWVNEEIRLFRSIHGDTAILPIIVDGTPQTAFPAALTEGGLEPLAADMTRKKGGFQLARLQLAAPMLGVTLDSLIRRDAIRRRKLSATITGGSLVFSAIMAAMTWLAIDGNQRAQTSRNEAESLIEYMIKDLRAELEPLGKLEILNNVGDRVDAYYDAIPRSHMDNDRLARLARTQHLLGEVFIDQRQVKKAEKVIGKAFEVTQSNLSANPNDPDTIFNHAQSEFWLGTLYSIQGALDKTLLHWANYKDLSVRLHDLQPDNFKWTMEAAHAANNMSYVYNRLEKSTESQTSARKAIALYETALRLKPYDLDAAQSLANALSGLANTQIKAKEYGKALDTISKQNRMLEALIHDYPDDKKLEYSLGLIQVKKQRVIFANSGHCEIAEYEQAIERLHPFSDYDPDNKSWALNYIHYYIDFLHECRADMSAGAYAAHYETLKKVAAPYLPDSTIKKKIDKLSKTP